MEHHNFKKPVVIAEIGCNHMGDFEIAKKMISVAKYFCEIDIVKFQKRTPAELLTPEEYHSPHPEPHNSYGNTYGKHREFLEFNKRQHEQLKKYCERNKIEYSSSVWDITSAKDIINLKPKMIKIPSACNLDFDLLDYVCKKHKGDIHLSLGMTTRKEERDIINFLKKRGRIKDVVLYACTSGYPIPFEDVCLLEIDRLRSTYSNIVKAIGFSGHHLGISVDIAAYTLGATYIERHFTLDRTWKGTDHAASLEPGMLRSLVRDLTATYKAMNLKNKDILDIEEFQRKKLKRIKTESNGNDLKKTHNILLKRQKITSPFSFKGVERKTKKVTKKNKNG